MRALQIVTRASAALITAAGLTCGTVAVASASPSVTKYPCTGIGTGSTAAAAQGNANNDLFNSYEHVYPPLILVSDTESGGVWYAEVKANCSGIVE